MNSNDMKAYLQKNNLSCMQYTNDTSHLDGKNVKNSRFFNELGSTSTSLETNEPYL